MMYVGEVKFKHLRYLINIVRRKGVSKKLKKELEEIEELTPKNTVYT